jgi:hypothetical protein
MQPARFKLHAEERTSNRDRAFRELECTNPCSPRGQPVSAWGERTRELVSTGPGVGGEDAGVSRIK